jgi:hypothetical protein
MNRLRRRLSIDIITDEVNRPGGHRPETMEP